MTLWSESLGSTLETFGNSVASVEPDRLVVWEPRDQNMAYFNKVRQVAKFGMIMYHKIVINNLI